MAIPIEQFVPQFKRRTRKLQRDIPKSPKEVAQWGARFGKTIAPRRGGYLANAIAWRTIPGQKESQALVYVRSATNPAYPGKYGRVPRYAAIQHKLALGARTQAKTGDPHWAFTVAKKGQEKFKRSIFTHIQKFIGR